MNQHSTEEDPFFYQLDLSNYQESLETERHMMPMHEHDKTNIVRNQYKGRNDDNFQKEVQHDEDQMIISGDSIDRFLKSNDGVDSSGLNTEEPNSATIPKMSNLIIAMALQNNFCPTDQSEGLKEGDTVSNSVVGS